MDNATLAARLERVAVRAEVAGTNPFRVRALRRAASSLANHTESVVSLAADPTLMAVQSLPGIGAGLATMLFELVSSGTCAFEQELMGSVDDALLELLQLEGLGPKTLQRLHQDLGIRNLDDFDQAVETGQLAQLKGMGPKKQAKLAEAAAFHRTTRNRFLLAAADNAAPQIARWLSELDQVQGVVAAGAYARREPTLEHIAFVVVSQDPSRTQTALATAGAQPTDSTCRWLVNEPGNLPCHVFVSSRDAASAARLVTTATPEVGALLAAIADERDQILTHTGLASISTGQALACESEEALFAQLGLQPIPIELRDRPEAVQWAQAHTSPALVTLGNIHGDVHMHTTYSDGRDSIVGMAQRAADRGLRYVAITDHSRSSTIAGGLSVAELESQLEAVAQAQQQVGSALRIFCGTEVDILADGQLDYPHSLLSRLNVVVGSVHASFRISKAAMTKRLVRAIESGFIDILGHGTGRLLLRRQAYDFDHQAVFSAAARMGVAVEINANPLRLDVGERTLQEAQEAGCGFVINTDAHSVHQLANMAYGIDVARRGALEPAQVLNAELDASRFLEKLHGGHR